MIKDKRFSAAFLVVMFWVIGATMQVLHPEVPMFVTYFWVAAALFFLGVWMIIAAIEDARK